MTSNGFSDLKKVGNLSSKPSRSKYPHFVPLCDESDIRRPSKPKLQLQKDSDLGQSALLDYLSGFLFRPSLFLIPSPIAEQTEPPSTATAPLSDYPASVTNPNRVPLGLAITVYLSPTARPRVEETECTRSIFETLPGQRGC